MPMTTMFFLINTKEDFITLIQIILSLLSLTIAFGILMFSTATFFNSIVDKKIDLVLEIFKSQLEPVKSSMVNIEKNLSNHVTDTDKKIDKLSDDLRKNSELLTKHITLSSQNTLNISKALEDLKKQKLQHPVPS